MKKENMVAYLCGGMINRSEVREREFEKGLLEKEGLFDKFYSPIENKEINDKKKANNDGLAERIFAHDTSEILKSNVMIAEAMTKNIGSVIEIGQAWGLNHFNDRIREVLDSNVQDKEKLDVLRTLIDETIPYKHLYAHQHDIRFPDEPEQGYRRSFGYHQYLLGIILDMTGKYPHFTFEELLEDLKEDLE